MAAITFQPNQILTAEQLNAAFADTVSASNPVFNPPIPVSSGGTGSSTATGATSNLQYQYPAAGSVPLSLSTWFGLSTVYPEEFGAVGDGVTDDSAAFIAAAATGKTILCSAKTYQLNAGFTLAVQGQQLLGQGFNTLLKFVGNFDCITVATGGGNGGGVENLKIDATGMTGGYTLSVNQATRLLFKNVRGINGFNGIHLVQFNTVAIQNCNFEGYRGTRMIYADGTTQRSDILQLDEVTIKGNGTANPDGLVIDGFVNTIQAKSVVGLSLNRFILHTNSAATSVGNFARYWDVEGDLSNVSEQVRLEVGADIHFTDPYLHGSQTTDGVFIANGVDVVSFKGGKITGHNQCGVNINGSRVKIVGTLIGGNSQAGSASFSAVLCGATAVKVNVVGCETGLNTGVTKMQKYGFEVAAGATDCNWVAGSLKDNVTGEWIDNSGGVYGNVNVIAYSGVSAPTNNSYLAIVPSSGGTTTIANNQPTLLLTSGSTTTTYTVVMPPSPRDGMVVSIGTRGAVTTFTLNGNAGQTMNSAPTTLAAGEGHAWVWRAASTNWFRLY